MKAAVIYEHGGPEVLKYEDFPDPEYAPDEVLVRVRACSINHLDLWIRQGLRDVTINLPHICGCDVAGEVAEVGGAVEGIAKGDRVVISPGISCGGCQYCLSGNDNFCRQYQILGGYERNGGYAEYVVVPPQNIIQKPENLSFEDVAAIPLTFLTAWHMLVTRAKVRTGETVLVIGGGSGVGSAAIQVAKLYGATVIATAGSEDKIKKARQIGADYTINHSTQDIAEEARSITKRKGVDIVFEHVGKATWDKSIQSLTHGGRLITCGATSGPDVSLDLRYLYRRQLTIMGNFMGSKGEVLEIMKFVESGKLKPVVDRVMQLKNAAEAHKLIEDRAVFGKVILKP